MLYTRKGDNGQSGLFKGKKRLPKTDSIYTALGTLDEINSLLGVCYSFSPEENGRINTKNEVRNIQEKLFIIQAITAGSSKATISDSCIEDVEKTIDKIERLVGNPASFIISGTTQLSALFDYARAVSRRAERSVLGIKSKNKFHQNMFIYLNRLSSLLYALARYTASTGGLKEVTPSYK